MWSARHGLPSPELIPLSFTERWGAWIFFVAQAFAVVLVGAFTRITRKKFAGPFATAWAWMWIMGVGVLAGRSWWVPILCVLGSSLSDAVCKGGDGPREGFAARVRLELAALRSSYRRPRTSLALDKDTPSLIIYQIQIYKVSFGFREQKLWCRRKGKEGDLRRANRQAQGEGGDR